MRRRAELSPYASAIVLTALLIGNAAQAQTNSAAPDCQLERGHSSDRRSARPCPPIVVSPQIAVEPAPSPSISVQPATPQITVQPATPQITVQPASPAVNLPPPEPDPTKWWAVAISIFSAAVAALSFIANLLQNRAAIAREDRARRSNALIQAFENNVARPIGMLLDQIEVLAAGVASLTPVRNPQGQTDAIARYVTTLGANSANRLRLCREADSALPPGRPAVFQTTYLDGKLEDWLQKAGREQISGALPAPTARSALDEAIEAIGNLKVALRGRLENERDALILALA